MQHSSLYERFVKPVLDRTAAGIGLLVLSPLLACVALAVRVNLGSPVLFRQERLGLNETPFWVTKFRTMVDSRDSDGNPLPDRDRITTFGTFLRKSSLDELPQLWNIAKGEMSFVGPRPLFCEYMPFYTEREKRRHTVRPGVTGLAQVSGRNTLLWDDRLELDVKYVETVSFVGDIKILLQTLMKVLSREDIIVIPGMVQGRLDATRRNDLESLG